MNNNKNNSDNEEIGEDSYLLRDNQNIRYYSNNNTPIITTTLINSEETKNNDNNNNNNNSYNKERAHITVQLGDNLIECAEDWVIYVSDIELWLRTNRICKVPMNCHKVRNDGSLSQVLHSSYCFCGQTATVRVVPINQTNTTNNNNNHRNRDETSSSSSSSTVYDNSSTYTPSSSLPSPIENPEAYSYYFQSYFS